MEMERINENTIRVIIGKEDLKDRGITFLDLMGSQDEIEGLFYSILEEVDEEERFQDTDTITFQALPNRDGIELYISKNLSIDVEDMNPFDLPDTANPHKYQENIRKKIFGRSDTENQKEEEQQLRDANVFIFEFKDFEDVIAFSKNTKHLYGKTNLYHLEDMYYIELYYTEDQSSLYEKEIDLALFLEYGKESEKSVGFLMEHGKRLMSEEAIEEIREYF